MSLFCWIWETAVLGHHWLTMEFNGAPKQPGYKLSLKDLPFCSAEQRNSYRFGTTWLQDFHLWVNYPFKACHLQTVASAKIWILHNIAFVHWKSNLVWIRREICTDQAPFRSEKKIQNRGWTFHWRKRYYGLYFGQKLYGLKLKTLGCSFLLYKTTEQLMKLGIGDWCAIDEIINLPKSIPKKTQTHMLLEWPES